MNKLQAGNVKVTLVAKTPEIPDKKKVTKKLNLWFSHSLPQKLIKVVSNTSIKCWRFQRCNITKKLHSQFPHPLPKTLIILVSNTTMNSVEGFKDAIPTTLEKCKNHKVYGKPGFKPVASVLLARVLQSCSNGFEKFPVSHCNTLA